MIAGCSSDQPYQNAQGGGLMAQSLPVPGRRPPLESVVPVQYSGGFDPRTFYRRYRGEVEWDREFEELFMEDLAIQGAGRGQLTYRDLEEAGTVTGILRPVLLWEFSCLLEREIRGIDDIRLNPLKLHAEDANAFYVKFVIPNTFKKTRTGVREEARLVLLNRNRHRDLWIRTHRIGGTECKEGTRVFQEFG